MAPRHTPQVKDAKGFYVPSVDAAERRRLAAEARSQGVTWKVIADTWYKGSTANACREVKKFWAQQPKETVEEIRSAALAKLDGIERLIRSTLRSPHYIVAEGHIVRDHMQECLGRLEGDWSRCDCPKLIDTKPVLEAADRLMKVIAEQTRIIPGMAAPARMEQQIESTVKYSIEADPEELELL